ncbi:MAG: hypothetical protein K2L98_02460 [Bacilli bacterium]|nr:hypothetical protein [Bacilli bacterium]
MNEDNLIIVIAGETGSGKSYLERVILPSYPNLEIVSKYTTRKPRIDENNVKDVRGGLEKEEIEAMDYHYVNRLTGESYGLKKSEIDDCLKRGKIPCVDFSDEKAYLTMLQDFPDSILILKIVPFFDEESMKTTFDRQGRDPEEFEERKAALEEPLTEWGYKYENMREVINPYFMRTIPDEISKNVVVKRIESVIQDECKKDLGTTLLGESKEYHGLYEYLYYLSKNRPVDIDLTIGKKGKIVA